jgi:hypothetical protein
MVKKITVTPLTRWGLLFNINHYYLYMWGILFIFVVLILAVVKKNQKLKR